MEERLYFAYGSNCNLDQMAHRCPDATLMGTAILHNYELLFRGNGRGNGVATIGRRPGDCVYGTLWKLTPECERALDQYEGYPHLYEKHRVRVFDSGKAAHSVMVYIMTDRFHEPTMPSSLYYNGIKEGFRQNGLPLRPLLRAVTNTQQEIWDAQEERPAWDYRNYIQNKKKHPGRDTR